MAAFAQLKSVDDPRDRLDRAWKPELVKFAKENNVTEIDPEMPAIVMRQILRQKGLTNIAIPNRILGQPRGAPQTVVTSVSQKNVPTTDAAADLARQWKEQQEKSKPDDNFTSMTMAQMRSFAKRQGVVFSRKDTKEILRAKLNGQSHAA